MTQQDVASFLSVELDKPITLSDIQNIEHGAYLFTSELLAAYCKVVNMPEAKILKHAKLMEKDAQRPEEELLEELIQEVDYKLWKKRQEGEE